MRVCVISVGGAAVIGDVLQAAEQGGVIVGTNPLGGCLVVQGHAPLPGGSLPGPDHAVDLLETLRGQRSQRLEFVIKDVCDLVSVSV